MSADGSIIVGTSRDVANNTEAFVWDPVHGSQSIRSLLLGLGVDIGPWKLDGLEGMQLGVGPDSVRIVGRGTNPEGDQEYWMATLPLSSVPEPAWALPFFIAVAGLRRRRTRTA
jgi:hypothetical protein